MKNTIVLTCPVNDVFRFPDDKLGSFLGVFLRFLGTTSALTYFIAKMVIGAREPLPEISVNFILDSTEQRNDKKVRIRAESGHARWFLHQCLQGILWDFHKWHEAQSSIEESESDLTSETEIQAILAKDLTVWGQRLHVVPLRALQQICAESITDYHWSKLSRRGKLGIAAICAKLQKQDLAWALKCLQATPYWIDNQFRLSKDHLVLLWQPDKASDVRFGAPDTWFAKDIDTSLLGAHPVEAYFTPLVVDYAAAGKRMQHKHGACLYFRLDYLRRLTGKVGDLAKTMNWEHAFICLGRNSEVFTHGWKNENSADRVDKTHRWKVLHAEIDCLLTAVADPRLRRLFTKAAQTDYTDIEDRFIQDLGSNTVRMAELAPAGSLGVFIVELHNSGVNYDSSQACPLCIKALKRWGIAEQVYSVDEDCLFRREVITPNEELVCEPLRSALRQAQRNILWRECPPQ